MVDGAITQSNHIYTIDSTSGNALYGDPTTYVDRGEPYHNNNNNRYNVKTIMGTNTAGFAIASQNNNDAISFNKYYCSAGVISTEDDNVPFFGSGDGTNAGHGIFMIIMYSTKQGSRKSFCVNHFVFCG